jgi:ABC-type sulfate/molybdate transport systems ATPase subunit
VVAEDDPPLIRAKQMLPDFPAVDYASDRLDLALYAGDCLYLVGPDSSGRTHYLRALAGIDPPAKGRVRVLNQQLPGASVEEWRHLRTRVSYVGQDTVLLNHLDCLRNVMFPALYHGLGEAQEVERRARRIIESLELTHYSDAMPADIGEVQRRLLVLARALVTDPKVLFLDRPLAGSDRLAFLSLYNRLRDLEARRQICLVWSSDELAMVRESSESVLFVSRGRTVRFDSFEAMRDSAYPEVRWFLAQAGES